jgi:hypothetical protein
VKKSQAGDWRKSFAQSKEGDCNVEKSMLM